MLKFNTSGVGSTFADSADGLVNPWGLAFNAAGDLFVTSGTLAPTVNQPIAMAYLASNHALPHHEVYAEVRGKRQPMRVAAMPFSPHRYFRG